MSHQEIDALTMQIMQGRFDLIIKEMCYRLIRSAYSSIVRESEDMGAGLFTLDGDELAESETTPMMMGTMNGYMKGLLQIFREREFEPQEGDVYIHNHPYYGASHAADLGVIIPIFRKGVQIGWTATAAHHCDTGAWLPGVAITTPDLYGESIYFLGERLYDGGKRNDDVWNIISNNVRVPRDVFGDLEAQVGSCKVGEQRFNELLDEYGEEVVMAAGHALLEYSERLMRSQIEKAPDGTYEASAYLDSDGKNLDQKLPVRVKVLIKGGDIEVDLTGSADQVATARNVPYDGSTCTAIWFTCRTIFMDQAAVTGFLPMNSGVFRPITIVAPVGCIYNPRFPGASNDRFNQIQTLSDTIIKALAPIIPLCAGTSANSCDAIYGGMHPKTNQYWVYAEVNEGAYGGSPEKDGMSAVDVLVANTQNSPIEHIEMEYPLRTTKYQFLEDATGAGKHRGGFGIVRVNQFLAPGMVTMLGDRSKEHPWGFEGGKEGASARMTKILASGERLLLPAQFEGELFNTGDQIEVITGSAGGWGNPFERKPESVLKDYLDGLISKQTAKQDYGVSITNDDSVDIEKTEILRRVQ